MDKTGGGEDAEVLKKKSIGELKELLRSRGVNFSDCIEKMDLVNRALETAKIGSPTSSTTSTTDDGPLKIVQRKETLGGLDTIVIENHPRPETLVVICHGYGANNEDLAPIGHETLGSLGSADNHRLRFLFPNAPISMGGMSRAWWNIDIARLMGLMMQGPSGIEKATLDVPDGLVNARQQLAELIHQARNNISSSFPMSRVLVGGFSQGSMVSTEYVLHCGGHLPSDYPLRRLYPEELPGGLAVFSGTLVNARQWREFGVRIKERKGMNATRVLQSHGTQDPLLPFVVAGQLKHLFENTAGFHTTFEEFKGGHTIPPSVLRHFLQLVRHLK